MKKRLLILMSVALVLATSCVPTPGNPTTPVISKTNWVYEYYYYSNLQHVDSTGSGIRDSVFTYPLATAGFSQGYSHQNYKISIPEQINLKPSDGLRLVMRAKNTDNTKDMNMSILCNDSSISAAWNGSSPYLFYCYLNIGSTYWRNISAMNVSTTDYHEYELIIDSTSISSKRDGVLAATYQHDQILNKRVDLIKIFPSGNRTTIDWVKLYKGNKLIMSEDFNTAGQTTAKWTLP